MEEFQNNYAERNKLEEKREYILYDSIWYKSRK